MYKSIQWKIVIIYFLLVILAMEIIGVYIILKLEQYERTSLMKDLKAQAAFIEMQIEDIRVPEISDIQEVIKRWYQGSHGSPIREVYILDTERRIIASSVDKALGKTIGEVLGSEPPTLLLSSLTGEEGGDIIEDDTGEPHIMDFAFPVKNTVDKVDKIIYLRAGMGQINETLSEVRTILVYATLIALIITVFLGSLLARSITGPIKEITSKAEKIAEGDFDHKLQVKSNDEIGRLTRMFNYMAGQLKETLGQIASEKGKMEAILAYMTDGVIAVNVKGDIILANPSALRMLGIGEEEISRESLECIFTKAGIDISFEDIKDHQIEEDKVIQVGDSILRVEVAPFKNEEKEVIGFIVVFQNITEQYKLETMRKEFVANVSHELRTPLTTIRSYVETLLNGALEQKELAQDFLQVVNSEAERMTRLVKDLLLLSRLEYQQTQWNKTSFNMEEVVMGAVKKLEMSAKQKGHTITVERLAPLPMFEGDKDRIEQVILNIISNAIKYTPDKGIIKVLMDYIDGMIRIVVDDNGIGIPESDLPRIFERFYRVDKARSRELGGTGLGLSIAKQIIEAHRGQIDIASAQGEGTTVTIKLPA